MKIGHSSINELGRVAGGKAGDQTGREVCFSTYTKRNYSYVLRAKDKNIADIVKKQNNKTNAYQGFIDTVVQEVIYRTGNNPYEVSKDYIIESETILNNNR